MNEKEQILLENFEEYYNSGLDAYKKGKYNVATTLFFKSIVALCDLHILKKEGQVPSSHTNRFRILEENIQLYTKLQILISHSIKIVIPIR